MNAGELNATATTQDSTTGNRVVSTAVWVVTALLIAAAVSRRLQLDQHPAGMWLTYPPRFALAVLAGLITVFSVWRRHKWQAATVLVLSLIFIAQTMGVRFRTPQPTTSSQNHSLKVLAFNIHDNTKSIAEIHALCKKSRIDVVMFQEVETQLCRTELQQKFTDFHFYWTDHSLEFEHSDEGAFTCVTGIRTKLIDKESTAIIQTGLTGYRTYAVQIPLVYGGITTKCWFTNVHSTKAFHVAKGLSGAFAKMAWKAHRHRQEKLRLDEWLSQREDSPILVAGDFNAPAQSFNLTFDRLKSAHEVAGFGSNLTFPRALPIWGIDHTLGNHRIQFQHYENLRLPYSDHCAQVATFSINQTGSGKQRLDNMAMKIR